MLYATNSLDKFLLLCEVSQKSIRGISRYLEISIKRDAWAEDSERKKTGNFGGRKSGISDWKKLFNLVVNLGTSRCPTDYLAVDLELVQTTRNVQCISQFHLRPGPPRADPQALAIFCLGWQLPADEID